MGMFGGYTSRDVEDQNDEIDNQKIPENAHNKTKISSGITIEGKISGDGVIEIEGTLIGEIKTLGTVTIEESGKVEGPVCGDTVVVAGDVQGNIWASKHLKLESTGSITGDITTSSLEIAEGGMFNGKSLMTPLNSTTDEVSDDSTQEDITDITSEDKEGTESE